MLSRTWWRVGPEGRIVGIAEASREVAEMNLGEGEVLLPAEPGIDVRRDRWDAEAGRWIVAGPAEPEYDIERMRRTGYPPAGDQLGVLIKIVRRLLAGEDPTPEEAAEFAAICAGIDAVKAAHPKT